MNQPENMTLKGTLEKRRDSKEAVSLAEAFAKPARWSVLLIVILTPWAFGSVHPWAHQWIAVTLLIGLGSWWFEAAVNSRKSQMMPYVGLLVLLGIVIGILQVLPVPGAMRDLVLGQQSEIYQKFSGDPDCAPRISLNPERTWGQIQMLAMALGGLLLGCRYFRTSRDCVLLMTVCAANGVLLSFFGIVQKLTYEGKLFWTFEVLYGLPFGPFINRNNCAGYLVMTLACCVGLIPIVMAERKSTGPIPIISKEMPFWRQFYFYLMFFISELTAVKVAVLLSVVLVGAGIIGTASRGGGLAMLVGGVVTLVIYGVARKPKNMSLVMLPVVVMLAALTGWIGLSDQLLQRFEQTDLANVSEMDGRIANWRDTWPATNEMGWLGSGLGSYRQVHRLYNSEPELKLFEYAENQYFQAAVEAGWPGLILFVLAWLLAARYACLLIFQGQSPTTIGVGTFGLYLLSSESTAAFFDFGMYNGANMMLLAVLVGMLAYQAQALGARLKKKNWLQYECPNFLVQPILLILFAGLTIVSLDLYRRARMDQEMAQFPEIGRLGHDDLDLTDTDAKIASIESLVRKSPKIDGLNYLAELWIHRCRLMYMTTIEESDDFRNVLILRDEKEQQEMRVRAWSMTMLPWIHENGSYLKRNVSRIQSHNFFNSKFVLENLPIAARYLVFSRLRSPLQPVVQIRLGQIVGAMGAQPDGELGGDVNIERAIQLAPSNPDYRLIAAVYYLQNGDAKSAAAHFHRYFALQPQSFSQMMVLLAGKSERRFEPVSPKLMLESMIPDDPRLLYEFAKNWSAEDNEIKHLALDKADRLLGETMPARVDEILLRADIRLEKGLPDLAIEAMLAALKGNPMDLATQARVARLLYDQRRLPEALEEAKKLLRLNRRNADYNALVNQIETELKKESGE